MLIKECAAQIKAGEGDAGTFTALVSVFGNLDSDGDVVLPGAFTDTLAAWKAKGDPIPMIWSHDWADPFSHIGVVTDASETAAGLQVTGQIDMDNPKAEQVYKLLKARRVTQFSYAYDVKEQAQIEDEAGWHTELRKLDIYETGPCLVGANQETELLAIKAAGMVSGLKEGRVLAAKHLTKLMDAHQMLGDVIDACTAAAPADTGKTAAVENARALLRLQLVAL